MTTSPAWTGYLSRNADGTYSGQLEQPGIRGWPMLITAEIVERNGRKMFALSGKMADPPAYLWIDELDGEKSK